MCGYIGAVSFNQIDINRLVKDNEKIICRGPDEKVIDYGNFGKFNKSHIKLCDSIYLFI